jgi:hypothetical protein
MTNLSKTEAEGILWLKGEYEVTHFNDFVLNEKQVLFLNEKSRFNLISGGMSSGKTLAFIVKVILLSQWFPGCKMLIGRKTKENAQETFMKDFMDICPSSLYEHQKGYGKIVFSNGSEAEFWGLDALQSGAATDIKKAEQKLKSHNFSFIFIDQLEDVEEKVFSALNSRMRRRQCHHERSLQTVHRNKKGEPLFELCSVCGKASFSQFNMTTNPANFWALSYFKTNPRPFTHLIETSMLDNRTHLSDQFIESELEKPERYVRKYVYGEWSTDSLVERSVFPEEYIKAQEFHIKPPIRELDGIKIWEEPSKDQTYQIGIDPSLGAVDPSSIQVICIGSGVQVAVYSGFVPTAALTERAVRLATMYSLKGKPLIIPEAVGVGEALIESLKRVYSRIYEREVFSEREAKTTKKLGFHTSHATKSHLIEHMDKLFSKGFVHIRDIDTLAEIRTFVYSDEVRHRGAGAESGFHDDRIMALMLAYFNIFPQTHKEKTLLSRLKTAQKKNVVQFEYE